PTKKRGMDQKPAPFVFTPNRRPEKAFGAASGLFRFGARRALFGFNLRLALARVDQFFLELRLFVGRHPVLVGRGRLVLYPGIDALFPNGGVLSPHNRNRRQQRCRRQRHALSTPQHQRSTCTPSFCSAVVAGQLRLTLRAWGETWCKSPKEVRSVICTYL